MSVKKTNIINLGILKSQQPNFRWRRIDDLQGTFENPVCRGGNGAALAMPSPIPIFKINTHTHRV